MVERLNSTLVKVSEWGDFNLVKFNASKTQACLFSAKKASFNHSPTFHGISIPVTDHLDLLDVSLSSNLNFSTYIESKAKVAGKKLGILSKVRRYFTPGQLLTLYKAQVLSCMEYCCHLWDGSAKYQLEALDSIERRARKIIGDERLTETKLQDLAHRRSVNSLCVFYKLHHGECSSELHGLVPPSPFYYRTSRQTALRHQYLSARRTFLRRTKATSPPDTTEAETPSIDNEKFPKRGGSRFKSRESARNETVSQVTRRPSLVPRRGDRPATRNFVRRRLVSNGTTTTTAAPSVSAVSRIPTATSPIPAVTRRPFRIASRRRPNVSTTIASTPTSGSTSISASTTPVTTLGSTLALESEESLQDIGDIDAIEDPSLAPKTSRAPLKTPRRPFINLKEEPNDQNPSATNEEESKRQSKKYSSSFRENQLKEILMKEEVTTKAGTTAEEYNAETALAFVTHQLITAPLPSVTEYDEGTKPTRPKTTYKDTTYTNTPTFEYTTYKTNPTQDFQTTAESYSIYDTPKITTVYEETKTTPDFTTNTRGPFTSTFEPYDISKTTADDALRSTQEDISTTDSKLTEVTNARTTDIGKFTSVTDFPSTAERQYTNFPTYEPKISTTFEVPKTTFEPKTETLRYKTTFESRGTTYEPRVSTTYAPRGSSYEPRGTTPGLRETTSEPKTETLRYSTPVFRSRTAANQFVPTTSYTQPPESSTTSSSYFIESKSPRGFSAPNVITPGYSGVQRGGAKYQSNVISTTEDFGYSTSGYRSSSQDPAYFTREYLLESPVTKTYDDEYQYLSSTTPATTQRKVFRKKIQRKISTTLRPTTPYAETTTVPSRPAATRVTSKPFEKVTKPPKSYKPVVNYDYYDDSAERTALKYAEGTKVILHGKGSIECLDVGNFPHPSSCKKFISCARMEFGSLLGWEYVCPQGLSFDPVGGICNWSAGLGCDEKD